ncbi:hypothetical protein HYPBUDRAFT_151890 [Hyphopichia burtonii NRRL Y-1933]|uniref:Uncharacterized protein n=1 Tax=Hyphopichia burtonii NRRL Y-1933 TaxID=984485 RepID=A0A1E4RMA5_9ASCO|nr:hypothetical protein HYPBUDRAFT_151890 [Hyphopichia burtonii NRRL Y-1933]ODV68400.1 hypothetical protein HYPBUDRAFT_151890 [Hyphopichia burtonii NRRL Y-1933]
MCLIWRLGFSCFTRTILHKIILASPSVNEPTLVQQDKVYELKTTVISAFSL